MLKDTPLTKDEAEDFARLMTKEGASSSEIVDALDNLSKRDVSIQVMIDSGLGKKVKAQRKHADAKVAEAADKLTAKWKEQVANVQKKESEAKGDAKKEGKGAPKAGGSSDSPKKADKKPEAKKEAPKTPVGGGDVGDKRGKVIGVLAKALEDPTKPKDEAVLRGLATEIEKALFDNFGGTGDAYTLQVKSLKFNLTDAKNKDFRNDVVSGDIPVECMPKLNSTQMAGREKIELKKANWEAATFQDQMFITAKNLGAASDMFQCKKCRKSETTFYQKQTRSGDEPMTVFITCKACGHEWRE